MLSDLIFLIYYLRSLLFNHKIRRIKEEVLIVVLRGIDCLSQVKGLEPPLTADKDSIETKGLAKSSISSGIRIEERRPDDEVKSFPEE